MSDPKSLNANSTVHRDLLAYLADHSNELLALTCELIATPSPNPPGDERAVVSVLAEYAAKLGVGVFEEHALDVSRPNIVLRLLGYGPGRTLMLTGHTDTKPVGTGTEHLWRTRPYEPVVRDGLLFGLGAADMKAAVAAMLLAASAIKTTGIPFAGELVLAFTADEEAGSHYGAAYLARSGVIKADAAILGEPCGITQDWEHLCLASRRALGFRTRVFGTQTHSSLSDRVPTVNAVRRAAEVLLRMTNDLRISVPPHLLYQPAVTHNIGVRFRGGVYYGVVPGEAEFLSDIRLPPGTDVADAFRQVYTFVEELRAEDPSLRIEVDQQVPPPNAPQVPPFEMPHDHPLVEAVLDAADAVLGYRPPLGGMVGGTDATHWHGHAGVPTIPAFGPGILPVCHGPNESVSVRAIEQAAAMYALATVRYLNASSAH